ncbi:MAG: tetratricopeptide repeat protein [Flavobacterium psychrophilum]
MKKLSIILCLFCWQLWSQNEQLAQNYFDKGEFEKAKISYESLLGAQPYNSLYFQRVVECQQQLQDFPAAEKILINRNKQFQQAALLVELGYNYQLQKQPEKAKKQYELALDKIRKNPNEVYGVATTFERHVLLEYALQAYELALSLSPQMNFNFQLALLHGQLGHTDQMIDTFLTEAYVNPQNLPLIQNQLTRFMQEDASVNFHETLKKALLLRAQKNPEVFWNQLLSWYYVQQREYGKAFIQEKAVYKRNPESLANIINLAQLARDEGAKTTAKEILSFVIENSKDVALLVQSHTYLLQMRIDVAQAADLPQLTADYELLLKRFGQTPFTLPLQKSYAHYLAFTLQQGTEAKKLLKQALDLPLNVFQKADLKMELADILVFEQNFNQALIYYSQIEEEIKDNEIGHEASLKSAKTSYYTTEFTWAQQQFKALKSASTQLIANDALDYFLLISDATVADSTQTALKSLAKADFLNFQNKNQDAFLAYEAMAKTYKGQEIEEVTLYRLAKLQEKMGNNVAAIPYYEAQITQFGEGIYNDEAHYFLAEIYRNLVEANTGDPIYLVNCKQKAMAAYEYVITRHEDSIYYTDARKKFRALRGDKTQ